MNEGTQNNRPLIIITGPTATGKTALGVMIAKTVNGEVVSADSMQIYKYMDVGTAKPSEPEMAGVAHHMLDIIPPWEDYSVSRYVADATKCIEDIHRRGKRPVIVGGTGLYIDSLISGHEFPARGDSGLRRELEADYDAIGGEAMLLKLREFDRESAVRLHANDKKRIIRAFEVYKSTGKTIPEYGLETRAAPPRYDAVKFALTFTERAELYARIDRRVDEMILNGLEDEARRLLDMSIPHGCTAMQAIGYREMTDVILCGSDTGAAVEHIKQESRRYAKRQLTWLRRDESVKWIAWEHEPDYTHAVQVITHNSGTL